MEIGAVVTALVTLFAAIAKWWLSRQPIRDGEKVDENVQAGRKAIYDGDVNSVNNRISRLLARSDNSKRGSGAKVTRERISSVGRVADTGRNLGEDS